MNAMAEITVIKSGFAVDSIDWDCFTAYLDNGEHGVDVTFTARSHNDFTEVSSIKVNYVLDDDGEVKKYLISEDIHNELMRVLGEKIKTAFATPLYQFQEVTV